MEALGTAISEAVLLHHGRDGLLARLSDPFWFQALGCVMGMDWHPSGITTSVMSALKRGLNPRAHELGRTHDWVVLYWEEDGDRGQHTVVTATLGPLRSRRVVRGREGECAEHYRAQGALVL